ncbi:PAP/fibrillin family protein [Calothrix sp. 336/3]|uniref:PAP/fibrillin family protein n=1 Tax=Calothrix sp. 336/3 TaxID=1337936 RepID=UPI0004E2A292|nr:PAP/fibrillin family protein [Calothrix sp. 336/3]AKG24276.1 PAP fibrillin [Calothrix sp. 336/3]
MDDNITTTIIALKAELSQRLAGLSLQQAIFPEPEPTIDGIVFSLEEMNPTPEPLSSDSLTGEWQLIYASRGTVVTRKLATTPDWMSVKINQVWQNLTVDEAGKIATSNCALMELPVLGEWQVQAEGVWQREDEKTALVSFCAFSLQATKPLTLPRLKIPVLEFLRNQAVWITSYLDGEMRIGRGKTGNLFVFRRR